jgi:hypothetical protein
MTKGKRHPQDYHDQRGIKGWTEAKEVPGWGNISDIISEL